MSPQSSQNIPHNAPDVGTPETLRRSWRLSALRVALAYALIAGGWIWGSDRFLIWLLDDSTQVAFWQTYKGWGFVLVTALLLYLERSHAERALAHANEHLHQRVDESLSSLERNRHELQVILDHAPVIIYLCDTQGRYLLVNEAWEGLTGLQREASLGAHPEELNQNDSFTKNVMQTHQSIITSGQSVVEEVMVHFAEQEHVFVRAGFPLFNGEGEIYAVGGIMTDITRRKEMEESLRLAEARFRTVYEHAGTGIMLVGADKQILQANPACLNMLGYSEAELQSMTFVDMTHPDDVAISETQFANVVAGQVDTYNLDKRYRRADGTHFWAHLTLSALRSTDGALEFAVVIIEDITEQRIHEEERRRQQEELERLVSERTAELQRVNQNLAEAQRVAKVGSWSRDLIQGHLTWSDETYRIFDLTPASFDGTFESFLEAVHPDDRAAAQETIRKARAAPEATPAARGLPGGSRAPTAPDSRAQLDFEHRIQHANGKVRTVHERGYVVRDETGKPIRMFGTVQDITERKAAEEALHVANAKLSAIVNAAPLAILVFDANRRVQLWNPAAERLFGWPAEEVVGGIMPDMYVDGEGGAPEMRQRVLAGEIFQNVETQRRRRDGAIVDVSVSTGPLRDEQDNAYGIVAVIADITERKRAETALRELNQELESRVLERTRHLEEEIRERKLAEEAVNELNQALAEQAQSLANTNRELETFTYSVSHDLKAPLRGLDGYSRLLIENYGSTLDEDARFFVTNIRQAANQMGELIDDLLAYSRLERRKLTNAPINLRAIVNELVEQLRYERSQPNVEIRLDLRQETVQADSEALAMVLRNLIDNALKFSANQPEPRVVISSEPSPMGFLISVQDNGVGFDMQYHERIFDIFQRLHRAEDYPGTGIGLAIVRKALQRIAGRAWAESEPGNGATFYVEIPT